MPYLFPWLMIYDNTLLVYILIYQGSKSLKFILHFDMFLFAKILCASQNALKSRGYNIFKHFLNDIKGMLNDLVFVYQKKSLN